MYRKRQRQLQCVENAVVNGCVYNRANNEEVEKLIEDMTKVRPEMLDEEALKL